MKLIRLHTIMLLLAFAAGCALTATAQLTSSPYSMYGYGILNDGVTSMQRQMGGVGIAMQSGRQINAMNPASYAAIDSLTFLWDIGADLSFIHRKEGKLSHNSMGGGLDYITLQFPVTHYMGMSVGLLPYSSVGYAFGSEIEHGVESNQGEGGLTQAYLGWSGKLKGLSIGFNIAYQWGNIINDVYANTDGGRTTMFERVMQVRDWNLTVGAQYRAKLSKSDALTLGLTWQPRKSMNGKTYAIFWDVDQDSKADTVGRMKMKGNYYQPTAIGSGISFHRHNRYVLNVEADFTWQNWADAPYAAMYNNGDLLYEDMKFDNRWRMALGGEFTPNVRGTFFRRITYRAGGHYTHDYLNIMGNNVREYGISAGIGLPTVEGKTMVNIGFEWKHRQASPQSLISENYYNITLGLNFNELWFWQRKLR